MLTSGYYQHSASAYESTGAVVDSQWSTEKKKEKGKILAIYTKTEWFWVALILVDLIAQGLKTARSSQATLDLLSKSFFFPSHRLIIGNLELAFTLAFDLEMIIRVIAHVPEYRLFFSRFRNSFDLFLVIITSIIQIPAISSSSVYPWLTIFQLLRWYRVILAFPRMRPLLVSAYTCRTEARSRFLGVSLVC